MNKFILLVKIQVKQLLLSMFSRRGAKKSSVVLACIFPAAISLYISGIYTMLYKEMLLPEEYYFLPLVGIVLSLVFVTMFSFYQVNGHLFKNKDYELLSSLPFSKQEVFAVKLISLYLYQLIYAFFMMLIPSVVYLGSSFSIMKLLILLITTILLPVFPMILSTIIGMIVAYVSSLFRNTTGITIIMYIALIAGIIVGTNQLTQFEEFVNVPDVMLFLKNNIGYLYYVMMAIKDADLLYFGLSLVYSILPMVLFIVIFAGFFDYINKALRRTKRGKAKKLSDKEIQVTPLSKTLFRREWKHYLNSPMYVLNTAIGPIMLVIGAVTFFFMDNELILMFQMYEEFQLIIMLSIGLMLCMMTTTATTISLEGKTIYLLKSLPIDCKDLFDAKIKLNLVMEYGISLIAIILYFIVLRPSLFMMVLTIVFTFVVTMYSSHMGLLINLFNPKMDYENETVVVKQSASVIYTMLAGMGSTLILGVTGYMLSKYVPVNVIMIGVTIIVALLAAYLHKIIYTKGIELWESL